MIKEIFVVSLLLTATSVFAAPPSNLTPPALECYTKTLSDPTIFTMNKQYKPDLAIEKMVVGLCTYSDAAGATTCYHQAETQDDILPAQKQTLDIFNLEQKYARLCSNARKALFNPQTGDIDAIDCFKTVLRDPGVLVASKNYLGTHALEDLAIKFCISANGLGASTCYKQSLANGDEILEAHHQYVGPNALDQAIVDLCKGTRLR